MSVSAEEGRVLEAIRHGDSHALEDLYRRHAPRIYALLLRMLRETADAEEVLQETFVDAWKRAGEYAPSRGSVPHVRHSVAAVIRPPAAQAPASPGFSQHRAAGRDDEAAL